MTNQNNQNIPSKPEKEPQAVEDIFDIKEKGIGRAPERPVERPPEVKKEAAPELRPEKEELVEEEVARIKAVPPISPPAPAPPVVKSSVQIEIENILSENLQDMYLTMTPAQRMQFRQKGEETASKIEQLIKTVKVKVREILNLIKDWLKIIPGMNKFFLEQEAKIKTDRVLALREKKIKQK